MATSSRKLAGTPGAVQAYLREDEQVVADNVAGYYREGEGFSRVWGKAAPILGLELGITNAQFDELFYGRHPDTGEQLAKVRRLRDESGELVDKRTPMIDVTVSAPKSVSVARARATPEMAAQIDEAMLRAAYAAHVSLENHAKTVRVPTKDPAWTARRTEGMTGSMTMRDSADLLAVATLQHTARPTDTTVGRGVSDPHLHVHLTYFTLAHKDGRWLTVDDWGLKHQAEHRDSVFLGTLATELERIGLEVDYADFDRAKKGKVSWELHDRDPNLDRYCSTNTERAWELSRTFEDRYGRIPTDPELKDLLRESRRAKTKADKAQDSRPVSERWLSDWESSGFKVTPLHVAPHETGGAALHEAERYLELVRRLEGQAGFTRDDAVFTADSIPATVARCAIGLGYAPEDLDTIAEQYRSELVPVRGAHDPRFSYFTTRTILAKEKLIAATADRKADEVFAPAPPRHVVTEAINAQPFKLDDEQRRAVEAVCTSGSWLHIEGRAGTGKTASLKAAVDAYRKLGTADQIVVASTAAATAERTGQKLKADRWGSVESIIAQVRAGKLRPSSATVLIVDEAAMVDTHRMADLLEVMDKAQFVLVGDPRQLEAIGAAGWYVESVERHGAMHLSKVHRQKDDRDIEALALLREGKASDALENLEARGRIHIGEDRDERLGDVMAEYEWQREMGRAASEIRVIVDSSYVEVDIANRRIQKDRRERRELRGEAFTVTDADSERRWSLHAGDQVIFLRTHVHGTEKPVKNGRTGTVLSINPDTGRARVQLDHDGGKVTVPLRREELHQPLGLAYAVHAAKYQGHQAPCILAVPGSEHVSNLNSAYSMLSRCEDEVHLFLAKAVNGEDPMATMARAWEREGEKRTATWHIDQAEQARLAEDLRRQKERDQAERDEPESGPDTEQERATEKADRERKAREVAEDLVREKAEQDLSHDQWIAQLRERRAREGLDRDNGRSL